MCLSIVNRRDEPEATGIGYKVVKKQRTGHHIYYIGPYQYDKYKKGVNTDKYG